jgi:hypothetical protein
VLKSTSFEKMQTNPEPGEAWLQYFRRTRQFCCLILLAWGEVEFHINQIVAKEFGIMMIKKQKYCSNCLSKRN